MGLWIVEREVERTDAHMIPARYLDYAEYMLNSRIHIRLLRLFRVQKSLYEKYHNHAPVLAQPRQHIIWRVPVICCQRVTRGMGKYYRRLRCIEHLPHGTMARVAQINHHAEPIHLSDCRVPNFGQARVLAGRGDGGGRCGEGVIAVVGECDVADAKGVVLADDSEGRADLVHAFGAEHGGNVAVFEGGEGAGGGGAVVKGGVEVEEAFGDIDLFEGVADGVLLE